jgi:hypothetical protein
MQGRSAFRGEALAIVFVLTLALLSADLTVRLRADTLASTFATELGALHGHAARTEFQNRLLSPFLQWLLRHLFPASVSDKSVWFALRVLQASIAYLGLYAMARRLTGSRVRSVVATALVAYFYFWTTLSHPWEYPSDFFDILFVAVMAALALERRSFLLAVVAALASTNRESGTFGGIVWMGIAFARSSALADRVRAVATGLALIVVAVITVLALRYGLGDGFQGQQIGALALLFDDPRWIFFPDGQVPMMIATLFTFVVLLYGVPRPWTADQKGLLFAMLGCAAITLVFGIAAELRVWLPCCTLISLLAVGGANGQPTRTWVESLLARLG